MKEKIISYLCYFLLKIILLLKLGNGSTWPGHLALKIDKDFIKKFLSLNKKLEIILIAGTNGKTTTGKIIRGALMKSNFKVICNESGANLINGIASSLITNLKILSNKKEKLFMIFEVDENSLPEIITQTSPKYLILLNLFRDQLDRYGELNTISENWKKCILSLPESSIIIANADDPQIASLGMSRKKNVIFFGLDEKNFNTSDHASDSKFCPNCREKLEYKYTHFSHLGDWKCIKCGLKRPVHFSADLNLSLKGTYNKYNGLASFVLLEQVGLDKKIIHMLISETSPAYGRQEIIKYKNKSLQIFLSKNPISFNVSLKAIIEKSGKNFLFLLNDRIPDGKDVSWIWDVDFESLLPKDSKIFCGGDRAFDIALRIKYALLKKDIYYKSKIQYFDELNEAVDEATKQLGNGETLYVLPTYSAMLDVRKILIGRKIL